MREILFRGKHIDKGFVYGYLGAFKGTTQIYVPFTEEEEKENEGHFISAIGGLWYTVIPETVGQFTGLTDKNGKKIFEGDFIKTIHGICKIVFEDGCFGAKPNIRLFANLREYMREIKGECVIVGNVYDNRELLERWG